MSKKFFIEMTDGYKFRAFNFIRVSEFLGRVKGSWIGFLGVTDKLIPQEKESLLSREILLKCYFNITGEAASSYEALLSDTEKRIGYTQTGLIKPLTWDEGSYLDARAIFEGDYCDAYIFIGGGSLRADNPRI